jgi:hypothetical protein
MVELIDKIVDAVVGPPKLHKCLRCKKKKARPNQRFCPGCLKVLNAAYNRGLLEGQNVLRKDPTRGIEAEEFHRQRLARRKRR